MIDLKAIEERANKATPGPWSKTGARNQLIDSEPSEPNMTRGIICDVWNNITHNAEFISHSREDIPALLTELAEYRKKEADGRMVEVPYPIGTKVYIIIRHGVLHDKILENVVCGYSESEWQGSINKGKDSRFVICHNSYNMPSAYELRDVFSTHAEAEAALRKEQWVNE